MEGSYRATDAPSNATAATAAAAAAATVVATPPYFVQFSASINYAN